MVKHFKFNKEESGRWFVNLPTWIGEKDDLEMVMGADTMLDIIAQGEDVANVLLSSSDFEHSHYQLKRLEEEFDGCWYEINGMGITPFKVWLCKVTVFVFGNYPRNIYLR